jgi:hypothetical protein
MPIDNDNNVKISLLFMTLLFMTLISLVVLTPKEQERARCQDYHANWGSSSNGTILLGKPPSGGIIEQFPDFWGNSGSPRDPVQ